MKLRSEKSGSVIGQNDDLSLECGDCSLQTGLQLASYLLSSVRPWANSNSRTNPQNLRKFRKSQSLVNI